MIHVKNPLAFAVVIINTHAQATWASLSWGSDAFLNYNSAHAFLSVVGLHYMSCWQRGVMPKNITDECWQRSLLVCEVFL